MKITEWECDEWTNKDIKKKKTEANTQDNSDQTCGGEKREREIHEAGLCHCSWN